jgi:hypothetical protein
LSATWNIKRTHMDQWSWISNLGLHRVLRILELFQRGSLANWLVHDPWTWMKAVYLREGICWKLHSLSRIPSEFGGTRPAMIDSTSDMISSALHVNTRELDIPSTSRTSAVVKKVHHQGRLEGFHPIIEVDSGCKDIIAKSWTHQMR